MNARHHAAAEIRLGRPLTEAELRVDVVSILGALEAGKERIRREIAKEQRKLAGEASKYGDGVGEIIVTDEMIKALNWLHEQGMREAKAELERAGVQTHAVRRYDASPRDRIRGLVQKLAGLLPAISVRTRHKAIEADLSGVALSAVLRSGARVPGALDAAGRLVSGAYYGGMGQVFEEHGDLVAAWEYSAIMDGGTCSECASMDGKRYETWEDAVLDMPNGGPNPRCYGDGRCRCRLVPSGPAPDPEVVNPPEGPAPTVPAAYGSAWDLPTFARTLEPEAPQPAGGWLTSQFGHSHHSETPQADGHLYDMAHDQGFTGLPHVVDDADLNGFIDAGERELWRGVEKDEQAMQFLEGAAAMMEPAFSRRVATAMHVAGSDLSIRDRFALAAACERAETFENLAPKWQRRVEEIEKTAP